MFGDYVPYFNIYNTWKFIYQFGSFQGQDKEDDDNFVEKTLSCANDFTLI